MPPSRRASCLPLSSPCPLPVLSLPPACHLSPDLLAISPAISRGQARFLKEELQTRLDCRHGRNVFLDKDNLHNLRSLEQHVRDSDVLVVVQSANFLTRPYCLLELLFAIESETPIVGVFIGVR